MSRTRLTGAALEEAVAGLTKWRLVDEELVRELKFEDFAEAMEFINRVAAMAEAADHHPDMDIRYNKVRLGLVTHDAGGITAKDVAMARQVDEAFAR